MAETVTPVPGPNTVVLALQDITAVGPPGLQGIQGPQGVAGPTGPPGPPLHAKGTVASSANLPASGNTVSDMWITNDTGHAWAWSGTAWTDLGPFVGPKGATGAQGPQGVQGIAATITVGPTTTAAPGTPANVVNTGTASAATFAFTIPQGDVGATGPQGIQGVQGVQGPIGATGPQGPTGPPLNMKGTVATSGDLPPTGNTVNDCYVALDTGHGWVWNGTTWIDIGPSMGPAGPAGPAGSQGPQGSPGPAGATGPQGVQGVSAYTTTTASFTVPPVGSSVVVTFTDASWVTVGQMLAVQTAGGTAIAGSLQVTAKNGNQVTLLNPSTPSITLANTSAAGLLAQVSGLSTDYVGGDNVCHDLGTGVQPTIWLARLRSFNAMGNPNFEVDQRTVGAGKGGAGASGFAQDRWYLNQQTSGAGIVSAIPTYGNVNIPGTNFCITQRFLRITLVTAQASLAAGDIFTLLQLVEGPQLRELLNGVHSFSILCRSSVANLIIGFALRDAPALTSCLVNSITLGAANTWTLISLANLPIWQGTYVLTPGNQGYQLNISLAVGSTNMAPSSGSWLAGTFVGAPGMSNFLNSPVNSTFDIAFVQHEPGPVCTTLIDKPFSQNLDECLRYYAKSYDYDMALGTVSANGVHFFMQTNTAQIAGIARFPKLMAKVPTLAGYNHSTGAANSIRLNSGNDYAISNFGTIGKGSIYCVNTGTLPAVVLGAGGYFHYSADTGW